MMRVERIRQLTRIKGFLYKAAIAISISSASIVSGRAQTYDPDFGEHCDEQLIDN